jgi:hypothetical protein
VIRRPNVMKTNIYFLTFVSLLVLHTPLFADSIQDYSEIYSKYPTDRNIVGIGEIEKTGNLLKDKRVVAVMARLDIAKQIRVKLREETLDIACEGTAGMVFGGGLECRNEFVMIIEETVDEVLVGSSIVESGERGGIVYSVAVLPRRIAAEDLERNVRDSIDEVRENMRRAQEGDHMSLQRAQEGYARALTYEKEREIIEGVRSRSSRALENLEGELIKLGTSE